MGLLQNILQKHKEKKQKFRELDEDVKMNKLITQKQKSSNERELERYLEEEREKDIAKQLAQFRKVRQKEAMKTTVFNGKNQFANQKNIFAGHKNLFSNGGNLYFK